MTDASIPSEISGPLQSEREREKEEQKKERVDHYEIFTARRSPQLIDGDDDR